MLVRIIVCVSFILLLVPSLVVAEDHVTMRQISSNVKTTNVIKCTHRPLINLNEINTACFDIMYSLGLHENATDKNIDEYLAFVNSKTYKNNICSIRKDKNTNNFHIFGKITKEEFKQISLLDWKKIISSRKIVRFENFELSEFTISDNEIREIVNYTDIIK